MRKDINIPRVENISVAVVKELNEEKTDYIYNVYLLNLKDSEIENVLVTSKGYGKNHSTGEIINSSTLRHFIGNLGPKEFAKIEPIVKEVFGISNEFWVSFYSGGKMYDKKFVFLAESITDSNMINVPLIKEKGVVI